MEALILFLNIVAVATCAIVGFVYGSFTVWWFAWSTELERALSRLKVWPAFVGMTALAWLAAQAFS